MAIALDTATPLAEMRLPTICSGVVSHGKLALRLPADMHSLQPAGFEYVRNFAHQHELGLLENRRRVNIQPIVERRNGGPKQLAKGLGLLLKKAGLAGVAKSLSCPHSLAMSNPTIPISRLISAVYSTLASSEHCVLTPSRLTESALGHGMNSIACYTGNLNLGSGPVAISHFVSRDFRCVGYSTGNQYVVHQLIGGGPLAKSALWVSRKRLADCDFRLQIFQQGSSDTHFGLFYRTIYLSADESLSDEHTSAAQPRIADTHEFALG